MTREIKFRVWSKQHGMSPDCSIFDIQIMDAEGLTDMSQVEILKYTGLKDKNGREIYEGDIYHQGDKDIKYIVVWHDTGLIGKQMRISSYAGLQYWRDRIEVIGNIYENPDLLKGA
ncbi:MAG: hypothetical protein K0R50_1281 [Eubacterium sp.]|nr:hypothetical protein [Eubacterium sp.]